MSFREELRKDLEHKLRTNHAASWQPRDLIPVLGAWTYFKRLLDPEKKDSFVIDNKILDDATLNEIQYFAESAAQTVKFVTKGAGMAIYQVLASVSVVGGTVKYLT
jgi:hypothetical protein